MKSNQFWLELCHSLQRQFRKVLIFWRVEERLARLSLIWLQHHNVNHKNQEHKQYKLNTTPYVCCFFTASPLIIVNQRATTLLTFNVNVVVWYEINVMKILYTISVNSLFTHILIFCTRRFENIFLHYKSEFKDKVWTSHQRLVLWLLN